MQIGGYEIQVPFVTTSVDHVKIAIELANIQPGDIMVDLGAGNGRVVIEFAKAGAIAQGYEIKPKLIHQAQEKIVALGLESTVTMYQKNFWEADLSPFRIVYVYGMQSIMGRLEKKLTEELTPGTRVIANIFRFPRWKVRRTKERVYLYIR